MILRVMKPTEVEVTFVRIQVAVRNDEDMPNDFPFRKGDLWDVTVEVDTGRILGWPDGRSEELYMKVIDSGTYTLLDSDKQALLTLAEVYVPHGLIPGEFGDYIELSIEEDGVISNWPTKPDLSEWVIASDDGNPPTF